MHRRIKIDTVYDLVGAGDLLVRTWGDDRSVIADPDEHLGERSTATAKISEKGLFHWNGLR